MSIDIRTLKIKIYQQGTLNLQFLFYFCLNVKHAFLNSIYTFKNDDDDDDNIRVYLIYASAIIFHAYIVPVMQQYTIYYIFVDV